MLSPPLPPPPPLQPATLFHPEQKVLESPPQKKHKIDKGDREVTSSDERPSFADAGYDSEEDYCPVGTEKMDKSIWERYWRQIKESEGFEFIDYPGASVMTTVFPMPNYLSDPKNVDMLTDYAGKALQKYNSKHHTSYEVVNILKGFDIIDYPGGCWMTTVFPMTNYLSDPKKVDKLTDYAGKALQKYNSKYHTSYEVVNILKVNGGGCRDFIYYITFSVKGGEHDTFQAKVREDMDYQLEFLIVRPKAENKDDTVMELRSESFLCC